MSDLNLAELDCPRRPRPQAWSLQECCLTPLSCLLCLMSVSLAGRSRPHLSPTQPHLLSVASARHRADGARLHALLSNGPAGLCTCPRACWPPAPRPLRLVGLVAADLQHEHPHLAGNVGLRPRQSSCRPLKQGVRQAADSLRAWSAALLADRSWTVGCLVSRHQRAWSALGLSHHQRAWSAVGSQRNHPTTFERLSLVTCRRWAENVARLNVLAMSHWKPSTAVQRSLHSSSVQYSLYQGRKWFSWWRPCSALLVLRRELLRPHMSCRTRGRSSQAVPELFFSIFSRWRICGPPHPWNCRFGSGVLPSKKPAHAWMLGLNLCVCLCACPVAWG
mmetsp:Transcript_63094/g.119330  ORF Transcript_63094/g.119330 Transcript_63094/m.119330 type:complete len:334 (+) Transcript_63094:1471-2472(+)